MTNNQKVAQSCVVGLRFSCFYSLVFLLTTLYGIQQNVHNITVLGVWLLIFAAIEIVLLQVTYLINVLDDRTYR